MNLYALAGRLQTALCRRGHNIKITQSQIYVETAERVLTKYKVTEGKTVLCDTYRLSEVVASLAERLNGGDQ